MPLPEREDMKSLVSFWAALATELGDLCGINASRDIETVSRRCVDEGDAFLRITLPTFGKAFDKALEQGEYTSDLSVGFRRRGGGLPLFLGGFLRNIFAPDGALLSNPCTESIRSVRQLTAVFGKIEGEVSPRRKIAAVRAFCEADDACFLWDLTSPPALLKELEEVSNRIVAPMLARADFKVSKDDIVPRHGPGQTADRLLGNEKFDLTYWPTHLEARFSWADWAVPNYRFISGKEQATASTHVVRARQTLVPKTMSTPRVIVMEPTSLQYMQQGLMATMVESIESTTDLVGFSSQERNREMARSGSLNRDLATLDLSEASDRVTYLQAGAVFSGLPNLWEALDATRSTEVDLWGDTGNREIHKFASMGSAVCFPVEAVVFLAAIFVAIRRYHRRIDAEFDLTWSFARKLEGLVRVYGDDLVVPVEYLPSVREVFAQFGWKINSSKSFYRGNFRESCGGDYWCGSDVTPVRVRHPFPTNRRQVSETQSLVSLRNQLYHAGYWRTVQYLDGRIHELFLSRRRGVLFPIVKETSAVLGRESVSFEPIGLGTDRYQRALTLGFVPRVVIPKNGCSEVGALLKCLIAPGKDDEHLERSGRPSAVSIKQRWMPTH
jgi:hypothetical protein